MWNAMMGRELSLGFLVELLVSLELTSIDVLSYDGGLPWWSMKT